MASSDERYTPKFLVEKARLALGGSIDLDPFSDSWANSELVGAAVYWDKDDDAFSMDVSDWLPSVYANPPYSRSPGTEKCLRLILNAFHAGPVERFVFMCREDLSTGYGQLGLRTAQAVCFPSKRIRFWTKQGRFANAADFPVCIWFYSDSRAEVARFHRLYATIGEVIHLQPAANP